MSNEIQRIMPHHFRIMELDLAGLGRKEIAAQVGMSEAGVGNILKSPIYQDEVARRRKDQFREETDAAVQEVRQGTRTAMQKLEDAADKAADTQIGLLDSDDESIQHRTAKDILDRVYGSGDQGGTTNITIDAENVQLIQQALSEDKALGGA